MKLTELESVINAHELRPRGYRVCFERRERGMLCTDYAPESDEPAFETEDDAWMWADRLANTDPHGSRYVNIYVVGTGPNNGPVPDYKNRMRNQHPARRS